MEIEIKYVDVDRESINPALLIRADIIHVDNIEMPIGLNGRVFVDKTVIAFINDFTMTNRAEKGLTFFEKSDDKNRLGTYDRKSVLQVNINLPLTQKAIDFIEENREKDREKSVHLIFDFLITHLELPMN